jgi:hypothetical protein
LSEGERKEELGGDREGERGRERARGGRDKIKKFA